MYIHNYACIYIYIYTHKLVIHVYMHICCLKHVELDSLNVNITKYMRDTQNSANSLDSLNVNITKHTRHTQLSLFTAISVVLCFSNNIRLIKLLNL